MSKYTHRLSKCVFSIATRASKFLHFGYLGEAYQRLSGTIGNNCTVLAIPDTGADGNIIDLQFAVDNNLPIKRGDAHHLLVQFADGTIMKTVGQIDTFWTFASGESTPVRFEVLENCCSNVIIGEEILTRNAVFTKHAASIVTLASSEQMDAYELAPFDFINSWQRASARIADKLGRNRDETQIPSCKSMLGADAEEQRRRDQWNFKYDFGAKATTAETTGEKAWRKQYDTMVKDFVPSTSGPMLRVPSIPRQDSKHRQGGYNRLYKKYGF